MPNKNKIKILFTAAEASPLAKVGGLGDVVGSLPKELVKMGLDVRLVLPFYKNLNKTKAIKLVRKSILIEIDGQHQRFDLYQSSLPDSRVPVYLVKHKFFDSPEIYWGPKKIKSNQHSIGDVERYTFFNKAVVEVLRSISWEPDIIHCHDWHTALLPTYIDEYSIKYGNFKNTKTLLTIHNLANQGQSRLDIVDYAGLHHDLTPALMEDYYDEDGQVLDLLKVGILSADYVSTVSPTYAKEILTKDYGENLEKYLWRRKKNLVGIVNGIDLNFFDPKTDKFIYRQYSQKNFAVGKKENKLKLQKALGLESKDTQPLFGLVSRLFSQKGLDILLPALEELLLKKSWQLVFLGSGQKEYEQALVNLSRKYPKQIAGKIGFDAKLAQRIYAASDFFLMPSSFEPCGLGQMIAMRYGAVPIVRSTGGLKDTVNKKNGFVFSRYSSQELLKTIKQALKLYNNQARFLRMSKSVMGEDFSWKKSAKQYISLYNKLIK